MPLIAFIMIAFQGIAQVKPFRFGVEVSPNVSWLSPDTDGYENNGALLGFSWGFLADITLTQNYFVKTGFNIDYQNAKLKYPHTEDINGTLESGTLSREYNLRYLELPLTLKMRTNQFGKIAIYGEIGFGAAFNLKAKAQDSFAYDNDNYTLESTENISEEITLMKGSLIVGAGIEYFVDESTTLITSLSFNNGLSNILKGDTSFEPIKKQQAHLYSLQLNIGVMF